MCMLSLRASRPLGPYDIWPKHPEKEVGFFIGCGRLPATVYLIV